MNKNNAGFWAFLGVVAAIVIGAFFLAPNMFTTNPESASQPTPQTNMVDATANAPDAPSTTAGEGQGLPADAAQTESDAGAAADSAVAGDSWVTPSFDVLRVEPDGSTVIAGKAEPGTALDIMNGETVIASTQVGASGDFAVILDNPLPAGDYQLTLRITGKDGAVRLSEEVATVSIPESADGELLAMVSKPGKASRIIAQPAAPAAAKPVETAAATPDANDAATPAATPDQPAAAGTDAGGAAPAASVTETAAGTEADGAAEGSTEMAAVTETPSSGVETPALPEASTQLTTSAPQVAGQGDAANATDDTAASAPAAEVALATPEAPAVETMPADATVRVDAVEIEGDRVFIAGSATPGFKVQVAADGVVIGTEKADETGRFIVEATAELAVGDHIINADLLDEAGENILLRATVPFNRPAGEALAAVAPAEPANAAAQAEDAPAQAQTAAAAPANSGAAADSNQSAAAETPGELILPDIASLSKMREDAFEALSQLKSMVTTPGAADEAAVSTALEQAVSKLKSAAMADLPAGSSTEALAIARSMRIQAEAALAVLSPKADDQAAGGTAGSMVNDLTAADPARMTELLSQAETALAEPADMAGEAGAEVQVAVAGESGEPKTILQAPLASTPGAVIIRRGDTLWQISRRTYGEGVRYTTIYVANRSQIQNPDRIKPGQVFSVPETPLENAEEMHQQLLGERKRP